MLKIRKLAVLLTTGALMIAGMAFAGPAAANTTDSCVDFGPGPVGAQHCFTNTSENDVTFAQVRMGLNSAGTFTLVCTDRWGTAFVKQGNIGRGGTRSFFTEGLFGLREPDCTLGARAFNVVKNKAARATVVLIGGDSH
jgi:hypothetical protein